MIRIGGMTPLTSIDFPGQLAAVLYLQGCPWRCGYCHNPGLIPARGESHVEWRQVVAFLHRRRGLLDGVVFSGGEPTSQTGLPDAIAQVAGLDTASACIPAACIRCGCVAFCLRWRGWVWTSRQCLHITMPSPPGGAAHGRYWNRSMPSSPAAWLMNVAPRGGRNFFPRRICTAWAQSCARAASGIGRCRSVGCRAGACSRESGLIWRVLGGDSSGSFIGRDDGRNAVRRPKSTVHVFS